MSDFQTRPMVISHDINEPGEGSNHGVRSGFILASDGSSQPVIEVYETHNGKTETRRFSMSGVVHALLNLEPDEEFVLAARRG